MYEIINQSRVLENNSHETGNSVTKSDYRNRTLLIPCVREHENVIRQDIHKLSRNTACSRLNASQSQRHVKDF